MTDINICQEIQVIFLIEGNTSDSVAERVYDATNVEIQGYGLPMYQ